MHNRDTLKQMPTEVFIMCTCGAYLVGSFAEYLLGKCNTFNDFDLIVPPEKWHIVALQIPHTAKINTHGGLKFITKCGQNVDIWPSSIEEYLTRCNNSFRKPLHVVDYINSTVFSCRTIGNDTLDNN